MYIYFIGEKKLLLFNKNFVACFSIIDKNLKEHSCFNFETKFSKDSYIGMLPTSHEYIICKKGAFLRTTLDGEIKNATIIKGLKALPTLGVDSVIYEPDMLIAYEQEATRGQIDVGSIVERLASGCYTFSMP